MQCVEFEDRFNRLLDHRLSPDEDERLVDHAQGCAACAGLLAGQQRLFTGLRTIGCHPPADLAERVMARRHIEVQSRRAAWRNIGWTVLLASAASWAGFSLFALRPPAQPPAVVEQPADHPPQSAAGGSLAMQRLSAGPAREAERLTPEQVREYRRALEGLAALELNDVSETLEPSIRPIQSSFGLAIDALRRTLPRAREARPPKSQEGAGLFAESSVLA